MSNKISKIVLWVVLVISIVVGLLFSIGGGSNVSMNDNVYYEPKFTDLLLDWSILLLLAVLAVTLVMSFLHFIRTFGKNSKRGVRTLLVLVAFVAVFVIGWLLGTPDKINIIGYTGTENQGFWAHYSDMCLYATYIMGGATLVALFGSIIYSKIKG